MKYHPNIARISPKYSPNTTQISPKYCPNNAQISPKYHPNITQISPKNHPKNRPNIAQISSKYHPNLAQIFPKYHSKNTQIVPQILPDITKILPCSKLLNVQSKIVSLIVKHYALIGKYMGHMTKACALIGQLRRSKKQSSRSRIFLGVGVSIPYKVRDIIHFGDCS